MGLLGNGWDDPQSNAVMQLAGGLLSGNFGQGAAAYGNTMAGAKDAALKRQYLQSQMDDHASQIEARKLAGVKDARQQALVESMFGGSVTGSPAGTAAGAPFGGGAPAAGEAARAPGLLELARQYGIPEQAIQADMVFNGGKKISELLAKHGAPDMQVTNGYAYDKNKVGAGFMPSLSTSTNGQTSMTRIGPDGMPVVSAPQGALGTYGAYKGMETGLGAAARVNLRKNADGTESPVSELSENPVLQKILSGTPVSRTGNPMVDAVIQTESNGNPNAVSPKGARGLMQVMPGTNTDPGFGVTPARDGSEAERTRVGQDYLGKMQERYKDPALAAIAYNWGPGNTDMWLKSGGDFQKLPAETKSYVAQVLTRNGVNGRGAEGASNVSAAPAYGMTNTQAAEAEATKTRMVDSSKAGTARIMTGYDNAQSAVETLTSNMEARKSLSGGAFVGTGAETKLSISKALNTMGFDVAPDKVGSTDYLQSTLGQGILNKAKTLGANPTDNDARIIRNIVGSISTDPNALVKLLDHQDVMASRAITQHNKHYTDAKGRGFDAGFDLTVKAPTATNSPASTPLPANATAQTLTKGQSYKLPNGAEAVWDGMKFKGK